MNRLKFTYSMIFYFSDINFFIKLNLFYYLIIILKKVFIQIEILFFYSIQRYDLTN